MNHIGKPSLFFEYILTGGKEKGRLKIVHKKEKQKRIMVLSRQDFLTRISIDVFGKKT